MGQRTATEDRSEKERQCVFIRTLWTYDRETPCESLVGVKVKRVSVLPGEDPEHTSYYLNTAAHGGKNKRFELTDVTKREKGEDNDWITITIFTLCLYACVRVCVCICVCACIGRGLRVCWRK